MLALLQFVLITKETNILRTVQHASQNDVFNIKNNKRDIYYDNSTSKIIM